MKASKHSVSSGSAGRGSPGPLGFTASPLLADDGGQLQDHLLPRSLLLMHRWYVTSSELAGKLLRIYPCAEKQKECRGCVQRRLVTDHPAVWSDVTLLLNGSLT